MFVTDKFVYLQLQKTGSTHITRLLSKIFIGKQYTKHMRPNLSSIKNKYIIGSIRNPWDWYVSLWSFGCQKKGGLYNRITSRILTGLYMPRYPLKTIKAFFNELNKPIKKWEYLYSDWRDTDAFKEWLQYILDPKRSYDLKEKYGFSPISKFGGFLTFRYIYLYSRKVKKIFSKNNLSNMKKLYEFDNENNILDYSIRNENLEDDLIDALQKIGFDMNSEDIEKIDTTKKTNISKRKRKLNFYYDKKSNDLIKDREKFIIDKYNYSEPKL